MFTVITDTGVDIGTAVKDALNLNNSKDRWPLSPKVIIERLLGRANRRAGTHHETASYGHYGRDIFPWEQPFKI